MQEIRARRIQEGSADDQLACRARRTARPGSLHEESRRGDHGCSHETHRGPNAAGLLLLQLWLGAVLARSSGHRLRVVSLFCGRCSIGEKGFLESIVKCRRHCTHPDCLNSSVRYQYSGRHSRRKPTYERWRYGDRWKLDSLFLDERIPPAFRCPHRANNSREGRCSRDGV